MASDLLLTQRVSDRIVELNAKAVPNLVADYNHHQFAHAQIEDAMVSIDPPTLPAMDVEVQAIPYHWIAAAEFCSKKWNVEHPKSGYKRNNVPVKTDVIHMPPFIPSRWKFSPFAGFSASIRCTERLILDVAGDLENLSIPLADWAASPTFEPAPRSAAMICALGREIQTGAGDNLLFLEERVRNILRMWIIERRKMDVRPPRTSRLTTQGMNLLRQTMQTRCLENPTLAELAEVTGLPIDQFRRAFRTAFKQTPHQYLIDLRLSLVREALARDENTPLSTLALACGFADAPHLIRSFKKRYGWTPQKFRQWTMPGHALKK